jgi:selenocysteine lyase/cysteine desulfurase
LEADGRIALSRVPADSQGHVDPDAVRKALRAGTRLVAIAHASNVTGVIQSVAEIAKIAHSAGALVLCDAAQTVGHIAVDVGQLGVDFLAASGHKGLLGPLGIGVLAMRPEAAEQVDSFRQGGTGTSSESVRQPDELPYKFEAGSQNVPGILGLAAGVDYLSERGIELVEQHGIELARLLIEAFRETPGLAIWGQTADNARLPLVSMMLTGYEPQDVAAILDSVHHIQVRAGLHCAPAMHESMGTAATGGTVRFSPGAFTTADEIEAAIEAVRDLATSSELAEKP